MEGRNIMEENNGPEQISITQEYLLMVLGKKQIVLEYMETRYKEKEKELLDKIEQLKEEIERLKGK